MTAGHDVLAGLKDFQRATVEHVFGRLYAPDGTGRFLVADEVGLGKTLIARGVIAKTIEHLRAKGLPRIDIIYICSSSAIAHQNINCLRTGDREHLTLASRLTLLPRELHRLKATKTGVNFVSFTPGTSFELSDGLGRADERALLYVLVRELWQLGSSRAPMNVFQGQKRTESFRAMIAAAEPAGTDERAALFASGLSFEAALKKHDERAIKSGRATLRERFESLREAFSASNRIIDDDVARERVRVVGELRAVLAESCVEALEPDLVILDEFQRFGHLLEGDDEASRLARALFEYDNVRALLLSATPYKMYTTVDEAGGEDHYRDFVRTLRFLERSSDSKSIERVLERYREGLLALGEATGQQKSVAACRELEARLRSVMVRTERLASTSDRNGMLVEKRPTHVEVTGRDVETFLGIQELVRAIDAEDALEHWKSAPYLLSFADDGYKIKRQLLKALETAEGRLAIARVLATAPLASLAWAAIENYESVDFANAKLRSLVCDAVDNGAWRLLWLAPSLPYYRLTGPFAEPRLCQFTKRLVFSAWRMVPRAVASLVSYEVERRIFASDRAAKNTVEARERRRGLLRFSVTDNRSTGMPVLAWLYPSRWLAAVWQSSVPCGADVELLTVASGIRNALTGALADLGSRGADRPVDERWYWAAPVLLDLRHHPVEVATWLGRKDLATVWSHAQSNDDDEMEEESSGAWKQHVAELRQMVEEGAATALGRQPDDLAEVLAEVAIGGPAVAALRALERVLVDEREASASEMLALRDAAAQIAWSFRALFNLPEAMAIVRGFFDGGTEIPYWKLVLRYCTNGCLQAVLDEYVHVLRDQLGLRTGSVEEHAAEISSAITESLGLRTARIGVDAIVPSESGRTARREGHNLRTHFALRFGSDAAENDSGVARSTQVQRAFNSPFWPFVLATTSVGQEGLDFHNYCHAVIHWNLPSNPVDLEQREGRVHRYKGHAVRKNVALKHGKQALSNTKADRWASAFLHAHEARSVGDCDIVPYWIYAVEDGARIERHVFALPLSREQQQANALKSALAMYRMVFGQPRQDDLVRYLIERVPAEVVESLMGQLALDLTPAGRDAEARPVRDIRVVRDGESEGH